ncbi:MAG: succinate dehydrogenase assembly factor 2 [Xanthomonadales bacterium]|nr:succinate dehydrogenase assembly factor 2 [Xanthomonadales bacterium]NIP10912.1 succinate dehydrogenase assembly factor 2 [Xanthomonadales bacterium]
MRGASPVNGMDGPSRMRRLRWLCRRGMKELDVLLEAFMAAQEEALMQGDWPQLEDFLKEEDDRLWDWLVKNDRPPTPAFDALANAIRE